MLTKLSPVWTSPPHRGLRDLVAPSVSRAPDELREVFFYKAIEALNSGGKGRVFLPPDDSPEAWKEREGEIQRHRYVEIGVIVNGGMNVWWEGETVYVPEGSLLVTRPGLRYQPHAEIDGSRGPAHSVVWLALHTGCALVHSCALLGDAHQLGEYHMFTEPQVTNIARAITQELADRSPQYRSVIHGSLLCLFSWLMRAPSQPIVRLTEDPEYVNTSITDEFSGRVEDYLLSHYHQPISLGQVARSMSCSEAYLCRRFRSATGQTPFEFLKRMRLEAAKRLLKSSVPVARIAEMVGYDDPLYFSKVFSASVGLLPIAYRGQAGSLAARPE